MGGAGTDALGNVEQAGAVALLPERFRSRQVDLACGPERGPATGLLGEKCFGRRKTGEVGGRQLGVGVDLDDKEASSACFEGGAAVEVDQFDGAFLGGGERDAVGCGAVGLHTVQDAQPLAFDAEQGLAHLQIAIDLIAEAGDAASFGTKPQAVAQDDFGGRLQFYRPRRLSPYQEDSNP